jgi:hypothetical protein
MSLHGDLAWFSGWQNRFPRLPQVALLSRMMDNQTLERSTRGKRFWPRPAEPVALWNHFFPGFSTASRNWDEKDVSGTGRSHFTSCVARTVLWQGKNRFLTKYTGWPRLDFIRALFADSRIVFIDRDPRAVVFSTLKQRWDFKDAPKRLAALSPVERIEHYSKRYLSLYGARPKSFEAADVLHVRYEDLVRSPRQTLSSVCAYAGLEFDRRFVAGIASFDLFPDANDAWSVKATDEEQEVATKLLARPLHELDYVSSPLSTAD